MRLKALLYFFAMVTALTAGTVLAATYEEQVPVPPKSPLSVEKLQPAKTESKETKQLIAVTDTLKDLKSLEVSEMKLITSLLSTYLKYMDTETRYGCGDKMHPRYFPQNPKLKLTYGGKGFKAEHWLEFRGATRMIAPAVRLVAYNEAAPDAYLIDITSVEDKTPVATITYRHSDFSFGSASASQPIFGGPGREGPSSVAGRVKVSQARFSLGIDKKESWAWATTLTLGKGNFPFSVTDRDASKVKDKPDILLAIAEGVKKFELSLPESNRFEPVDYDNLSKGITVFNHSTARFAGEDLDVVVVELNEMHPEGTMVFAITISLHQN